MTRCVVCGALPAEECNRRTHDAHYRMWYELSNPGWPEPYPSFARRLVAAIDEARTKNAA